MRIGALLKIPQTLLGRCPYVCFSCGARPHLDAFYHRRHKYPLTFTPVRGAKSRASVQFDDLPQQSADTVEPLQDAEDEKAPSYPTVVREARDNMRKYENCVLLTRVGSFYEVQILDDAGTDFLLMDVVAVL